MADRGDAVWPPRRINYGALIDQLGGPQRVAGVIVHRGWAKEMTYFRVYQWRRRSRVPAEWVPYILALALEMEVIESVAHLLQIER